MSESERSLLFPSPPAAEQKKSLFDDAGGKSLFGGPGHRPTIPSDIFTLHQHPDTGGGVLTSANPTVTSSPNPALTAARSHDSVLFSLSNLHDLSKGANAAGKDNLSIHGSLSGEQSGLIEIRALAGAMNTADWQRDAAIDDTLIVSTATGPLLAAARPVAPKSRRLLIPVGVTLFLIANAVALVLVSRDDPNDQNRAQREQLDRLQRELVALRSSRQVIVPEKEGKQGEDLKPNTPTEPPEAQVLKDPETPSSTPQPKKNRTATAAPLAKLTRTQVIAGMNDVKNAVAACGGGKNGTFRIRATISASGRVTEAAEIGPFAGTLEGNCAVKAVRRAKFPKSRESTNVTYPFKL